MVENGKNKKSKSLNIIVAIIVILLLLASGVSIYMKFFYKEPQESPVYDKGLKDYDGSNVEITSDTSGKEAGASGNVNFQVYGDFACSEGGVLDLVNPSNNDVDFRYVVSTNYKSEQSEDGSLVITDYGDTILEEMVPPGKAYPWVVSDYLEKGKSDILITVVAIEDGNSLFGNCYPCHVTLQ